MRDTLATQLRLARTNVRSTRKKLLHDSLGDLMYRLAALQAELDRGTTPARREELKKQIAELTEKMLARIERGAVSVSHPKKTAAKAKARRRRAR